MKWTKDHERAKETCKDILKKGGTLAVWIAFGIPDEDRIKVIQIAKEELSKQQLF